eukprot:GHVQ01010784.1.p1 GENE.GHVQ01010784.1~~GHVQ01010784.1.p1  ORF type:complete len:375 (-),score=62.41 GHVQ01010784.1:280-1404(-)
MSELTDRHTESAAEVDSGVGLRIELEKTLSKHSGGVLSAEWTHDGQYCLTVSQDKSLMLWNPVKGTMIRQYNGPHNQEINDVCITRDKCKFASVGGDRIANLWDVSEGRVIRKFIGHTGRINCCEFSPSSDEVLLTASYDKKVSLWDLKAFSKNPIQSLTQATDAVTALRVTGDKIIAGSVDGCVRTYDIRMGKLFCDKIGPPIVSLALSSDSACMAASCLDNLHYLLDLSDGLLLSTYKGHAASRYRVQCVIDPTDRYVVSGSEDCCICVWDLVSGAATTAVSGAATTAGGRGGRCVTCCVRDAHEGVVYGVKFRCVDVGGEGGGRGCMRGAGLFLCVCVCVSVCGCMLAMCVYAWVCVCMLEYVCVWMLLYV